MKTLLILLIIISSLYSKQNINKLINEESPYLLRHANNPVNWYPWKEDAFIKAKKENKLIFVSIGYSTCHWCTVMEKESFENKEIAKLLNSDYVSIKVDREELPHIDANYQEKLRVLKDERNAWPLNFILNPNKEILYITSYIPKNYKYGVEGMDTLIPRIAKEYKEKKIKVLKKRKNQVFLNEELNYSSNKANEEFTKLMEKSYDKNYHGFEKQPKFPLLIHLSFLYDLSQLKKDKKSFDMVETSLLALINKGLYDHVQGGFYRYSVYDNWIIPHFEKMLYTQAEALPLLHKLYIKTSKEVFKDRIVQSVKFIEKNFKNKEGLYYSAIDADSKNFQEHLEEGFYYTYSYDETEQKLKEIGIQNSEEILEYFGFDYFGNFENELNNIYLSTPYKNIKNKELALKVFKKIRSKKQKPFVDKKIITSWNALMIKAMFNISTLDKNYLLKAEKSLNSLLEKLYINKKLYHQKVEDKKPKQKALLEDYTFLTDLLLSAYSKSYKKEYLNLAIKLNKQTLKKFYKKQKWFFDEKKEYEVNFLDKYYVSAISKYFHNSITIAKLTYDLEFLAQIKKLINKQKPKIYERLKEHPSSLKALTRVENKDIILKSSKTNLLKAKKEIEKIAYPFLLTTTEETDLYLACDEKTCFAYDKDLKNLIKKIDK